MKLTKISTAILLTIFPATFTFAAGLDRSGQSISSFLQLGHYVEAGISVLDPDVKGKDTAHNSIGDMADDYYFPSAALKIQATDKISLGLIYDQPYGAASAYRADEASIFNDGTEGTFVVVDTQSITALMGYQPNQNWNFYAGPVWQTVEADIKLRGAAYSNISYNIQIEQKEAWGWIAGFAYSIPEIALKTSVTYRSEISHNAPAIQSSNVALPPNYLPQLPDGLTKNRTDVVNATTPQSVNIDLQTGVAENTLAFTNIRWVNWSQFAVKPSLLGDISMINDPTQRQNLIDYTDDQWSVTMGLGHKFSDQWSSSALIGYDSGAGNPVTTLGPTEGYWSVGLGAQYSPAVNYFIQAGVRYFWLGDAAAQTSGNIVGQFESNHALGYSMKIGYRF